MLDLPERLWRRISPEPNTGCWLWEATGTRDGYGHVWFNGVNRRVHRVVYELLVGPIPTNTTLDHKCRIRCCVNPEHLRLASHQFNVLVGETITAANAAKFYCVAGHPFDAINTYITKDGRRQCRKCGVRRVLAYQRKKNEI